MPSSDSSDREKAPIDEFAEAGPSPTLVVACGLSVMAFSTFLAIDALTQSYDDTAVAFALSVLFFAGAYTAANGFFEGLEKATSTDD
jgi:hypothetical protein